MTDVQTHHQQVVAFSARRPRHVEFSAIVQRLLEHAAHELGLHAIVQSRTKDIPGFAEKIRRKGYVDPFRQMTDLCGARIITETSDGVRAVCAWIRQQLQVDEGNSQDVAERLEASQFGYRSVHFVVSLRRDAAAVPGLEMPDWVFEQTEGAPGSLPRPEYVAEIQVRTMVQHAWASVVHDNLYKSQFRTLKQKWSRDASRIAALLENADDCFAALLREIEDYKHQYGSYLTEAEMRQEIATLQFIQSHDPDNCSLTRRMARLHLALGDPQAAAHVLKNAADADPLARRDLAEALVKIGTPDALTKARSLLEALDPGDTPRDAIAQGLLALSHGDNQKLALRHAERAFQLDPTEPATLRRYLERKLLAEGQASVLPLLRPALDQALVLCRERAALDVGLPWTLHDIALLELLRGQPYAALEALLASMLRDNALQELEGLLTTLTALHERLGTALEGVDWLRDALLLFKAVNIPESEPAAACFAAFGRTCQGDLQGPVTIVAGGCDPAVSQQVRAFADILRQGLAGVAGTVLSGGTRAGVSGLVGDLREEGAAFRLVSHLPALLPRGEVLHPAYEVREAAGQGFTPMGPLQGWMDILASGIRPQDVRVVGINGGQISAIEYMLAAALGAQVGLLADSGREAFRLLSDPHWSSRPNLLALPADGMTLYEFLRPRLAPTLPASALDTLGRQVHEGYLTEQQRKATSSAPSLQPWERLDKGLQASNLAVVAHYEAKLRLVGLAIRPRAPEAITLYEFTPGEIAHMAEFEHARWNLERLQAGWRLGNKDVAQKCSPYLVGWQALPPEIQQYDVDIVLRIPELLRGIGYEIHKPTQP